MGAKWKKIFKRIGGWMSQLSLHKKLVVLYVVIILVPILIFTWNISKNRFESSIYDAKRESEYLVELEKMNIEENKEKIRRTAQIVVANQELTEFISQKEEQEVKQLLDFKNETFSDVLQLKYNNPAIEDINVYAANDQVKEMWPLIYDERRIENSDWFGELLEYEGTEMWKLNHQEDAGSEGETLQEPQKISLYRELEYPKDEHLGLIKVTMLLENFFPKVFNHVENLESQMFVLDANRVYFEQSQSLLKDINMSPQELKEKFDQKNTSDLNQTMVYPNEEVPFLIVSSYIEDLGIHLMHVKSLEKTFMERDQLRTMIILGALSLIFLLSLITHGLVSLILKKLHLLIESMKKVEKGDFTVDVDIQSGDEIGRLSNHYRNMLSKINTLIAESVNKEAATKEAELHALKMQIDSHFLYNTLENIKMMAEIDGKYDISDALTSLGEMMRYNLKWKKDFVSLQEEVNHIRNYIELMNIRLDHRLDLQVDIPPHLEGQEVLKMTFQPIVENSVKHGLQHILNERKGIISIRAYTEGKDIKVVLTDNGDGMERETLQNLRVSLSEGTDTTETSKRMKTGSGIGLYNVHERVQLYYGKEYGLTINSKEGHYTEVIVTVPCLVIKEGGGLSA
ncbi:sensor histidine kinase [Halobacillus sp. GSS1]|uniref:sensor histidine kinase n=1 Tax=Halobacillus sp. GSS1 TaxID=2815919 RepID=UPI001A8DA89F|nr:sensor histidine kinase [Halobacillus sp. GSS1]MBN9654718.1 sensor histidine kinase [Halobacillus sp. GSS1]